MDELRKILGTKTLKQSSITFATTVVNGALGAVFYIVAARFLGPSSFGVVSVAITVLTLGASVGGLGVNTGLVRFVSRHRDSDPEKANRFLKLSLKANIVIGFVIFLFGLLISEYLAVEVFRKSELTVPLRISSLGVWALLLFGFSVRSLEAFQRFWAWGLLQISTNLIRVVIVLVVFFLGVFTVQNSMWIYAMIPLFGFLVAFIFLTPKNFLKVKNEGLVAKEFFHYNKWVAGFTLVAAFSSRIDTFMAARLVSSESLGHYSAAYQLVFIVPQIVGALGTVFAPKMSSFGNLRDFARFFKKSQVLVLGLAFLGILAAPIVALVAPLIFGSEYQAAIPVFYVLLAAMLVFLISVPVHNAVLYYFSYPKLFLWLSIGHLVIVSTAAWLLISSNGILGAAVAVLLGSIFNFVVPALWVYREFRKKLR